MKTTRKIMVVGTGSNVGKTTVTIGLMAAYKELGYSVQGFKCGPDYIDPTYQTMITGRQSRNLDSWMCKEKDVREIFSRGYQGSDIAIIEGVMGMFDGKDPLSNKGSSAEIAQITETPVLLVIDASGVARSAAAMVKGFQMLSPNIKLCGVVANYVGSEGHYQLIRQAVEAECDVPVVGYLKRDEKIILPERYAGLVPLLKNKEQDTTFEVLSKTIQSCFDLDLLYKVMGKQNSSEMQDELFGLAKAESKVKIAVAKDEAFHFYYEENLELLSHCGAELVYFSPLKGEKLPDDVHGLYIGGGFPEQFANELAEQNIVKKSIYDAITAGMPTLAEGGGFMYLCDSIEDMEQRKHAMIGVIPGDVKMHERYVALGYRTVMGNKNNFLFGPEETAKGHVFHYSEFHSSTKLNPAFETSGRWGVKEEGLAKQRLVASYVHLHFGSDSELAIRWIEHCEAYKSEILYDN